ncbi:methionine adenosyltransferase domain-containing protein [Candidatus Campbellbacteria bacterium]|nr:MAG: methionine adenosyltransferase domain-containing protein [Candidatus Campbellbacteria bacterium]
MQTAEAVTLAHPDKVCDQISDAILDACLEQDPHARVAVETVGGHGLITVTGEVTTTAHVNFRKIAQDVYRDCGYDTPIGITVNIVAQSPEIGRGVDHDGAGDQGIMVGYATAETPELMPLPVVLSRTLVRAMGKHDGKAQVTVENGKVSCVLTSLCESGDMSDVVLEEVVAQEVTPFLPEGKTIEDVWMRNPNGAWTIGGFDADTGLTGRKIAVDTYGPSIPVGGGAFSGKDATKVDRSGAYIARKIACDYLRERGAQEVFVHIAYAIGVAEPLMAVAMIDGVQEKITGYDLRPRAIIEALDLRKPQFRETAKYGHFGNNFLWDR